MDNFDLTYELQKMAAESPDEIEVIVDENGDIEFEMDVKTFVEILRKEKSLKDSKVILFLSLRNLN